MPRAALSSSLVCLAVLAGCHAGGPQVDLPTALERTVAAPSARFEATFRTGPLVLRASGAYDTHRDRARVEITLPDEVDESLIGHTIDVIAIGPVTYARSQVLAVIGGQTGWVAVDRRALAGRTLDGIVERSIDPLALVQQMAAASPPPEVELDDRGRVRAISDGLVSVRLFDFGKDVAIEPPPTDRETR